MLGISITVVLTLTGITVQASPSAAKSLSVARSMAVALRSDSAEIAAAAGKGKAAGLAAPQKKKIQNDISAARDATRQLWEVDKLASPPQDTLIIRIAPLMLELTLNTEQMFDRLPGGWHALAPEDTGDYFPAHDGISNQLALQIIEAVDKCTECGLRNQSGS